jgi:hypothetical protein
MIPYSETWDIHEAATSDMRQIKSRVIALLLTRSLLLRIFSFLSRYLFGQFVRAVVKAQPIA